MKDFKYPNIGYDTIKDALMEQQKMDRDFTSLPRSFIELSFLKASTRFQSARGLKGVLNRAELLEMIVRCANSAAQNKLTLDNLRIFMSTYVDPVL